MNKISFDYCKYGILALLFAIADCLITYMWIDRDLAYGFIYCLILSLFAGGFAGWQFALTWQLFHIEKLNKTKV
jgi:hypothetical protein